MLDGPVVRQLDITLERNSPVPLYYQLAQYIEHAINVGDLAPGDRIENELSLTSRLGLSRPTARQAIQELVNKGLLVRKRGVGTQVVRSQFRRDEKLSSLNEDLAKAGKTPEHRPAGLPGRRARGRHRRRGGLEPTCWTPSSSRSGGCGWPTTCPWPILTNYIPARYEITADDLKQRGLYACLNALGVHLKIAHQQISARLMDPVEAELLDEQPPAACLAVDRLAYDDVGRFVEFGRHIYRPSYYSIQSSLQV